MVSNVIITSYEKPPSPLTGQKMIKNHLILDLKSEILDLKMKDSDLLADNHRVKTVIFIRNNLQFWSKS